MEDDEMIEIIVPKNWTDSDDIIKVIGIGGGGCNAVDYMYKQGITGCRFVVCNSDSQALHGCSVPVKVPIGHGLGAGTRPEIGRRYALESQSDIDRVVFDKNTKMLFITAGMGGGTGTGAAPVIAKMSKEKGLLTVAVVTLPFVNEGNEVLTRAIDGVHELEKNVDSLLIINNEKLHEYYGNLLIKDALPKTDEVLATAVRGIVEIIRKRGYINVDFQDVETMMRNSGLALMGCGEGKGKNRIEDAVKAAFESPLLNDFDLKSARNVLINITCSNNEQGLTMDDLTEINKKIDEHTGRANNFKRGLIWIDDPDFGDTVRITSIVTGLRFIDIIRPRDTGNYIIINRNFVYDRDQVLGTQEISFDDESAFLKTGYNKGNHPSFRFDPDRKPVLIVSRNDSLSELENIPAIHRAHTQSIYVE